MSRPRSAHRTLVVTVLVAVAVMSVASFLPFLQTPCGDCLATPTSTLQVSADLAKAADAWIVLGALLLLTVTAILHVFSVRQALTALACFGFSLAVLAVPIVEVANNGSLLFPGATAANPITMEAGFYCFLLGACVAGLASLALVLASFPHTPSATAPINVRS